ncbi:phospho-sugar mutase [Mycoplasma putrefaciens]|uniref:Phosphoglucomutase/phosphomannomutase n=1 Tax=Mycoplasma putrefaciens Mput9231 TaxID=1292033 RepID=M9WAK0_9MOLU|nr:phospho-sugar mutase [Mycoplasma putrefaciens]AGJ91013.1 Phosphoglucomutase/phosphomannomutase [Mycoplasma putrefaciens Mput9231]
MNFDKTNKTYLDWINNPNLDQELKELLLNASDQELSAAFNLELEFGTAGIRGILGAGPGRFNVYTIKKVTIAYAKLLLKKYHNRLQDGVVVGHDNRHNSSKFAKLVAEILTSFGIKAYLFKDNAMKPTPVVSFATKTLNCIGGIVITASHNPSQYNGYKIYDPAGCQLMPEDTDVIASEMDKIQDILNWTFTAKKELLETVSQKVIDKYFEMIKNLEFYKNQQKSKSQIKIIFSAVNGTGTEFTPIVLEQSGYDVIQVAEHAFEDETFKNVINPNPEFDPAWKIPLEYAKKYDADLIIMNDPDADRFGMAVKHNNQFIRLNGNETGPVLIDWKLDNLKRLNKLPKNPALYSSFVTSDLGDRIASEGYGATIVKTLTGFKWMGNEIAKEKDNGLNFVFAYEESFGYVLDDSTRDKDGIQASIMIAEACWYYKQKNMTLIDYLDSLYDKYGYYFTDTINLNFKPEEKDLKIKPLMQSLRTKGLIEIANLKVIKTEDYINGLYNMPGQDLLKFYLEDKSWFAVRPSGTEPKLKIYFIGVDKSHKLAKQKVSAIYQELKQLLEI